MLLYYAQIHSNQLEYDSNRKSTRTVTINLLDFEYFKSANYHQIKYINSNPDENGNKERLEFHIIELLKNNVSIDIINPKIQ